MLNDMVRRLFNVVVLTAAKFRGRHLEL